jgi:hypothetical protein
MPSFFVVLRRRGPDWDPARPLEEQSGWREHADFMDALVEGGFVVLGGPLADEHRVVLAVEAASEDDVRATLAGDRGAGRTWWWTPSTRGRSGSTAAGAADPLRRLRGR